MSIKILAENSGVEVCNEYTTIITYYLAFNENFINDNARLKSQLKHHPKTMSSIIELKNHFINIMLSNNKKIL